MLRCSKFKNIGYCFNFSTAKESLISKTVLLPKTKFPLRLGNKKLTERDKIINNNPQFLKLYEWQRTHLTEPMFVLHDGPPYANGVPHMGHAMNKILKDIIVRCKILKGQKVHYVPGWDCHGLPIEMKVIDGINEATPLKIREKARNFAKQTIERQKSCFMSWGVVGDWDNFYTTFSKSYIKNQMNEFYNLYNKKLIYRDVKPVYWSPSSRTALAEAELEYNPQHKSIAITLKLKLDTIPVELEEFNDLPLYALIWTTTPWSLPSNQGICYNYNLTYSVVLNKENEYYIIATNLVQSLSENIGMELKIIKTFSGHALKHATYIHPIYFCPKLPFIPSSHASDNKGTGLVHMAPAHGPEDYIVALDNKIPVKCMVDEAGQYTSEAGSDLSGLHVLSNGTKTVLNMVQNNIIHREDFIHSYPYDWRTKQPVILRASKQWFIDTSLIKNTASQLLERIEIFPKIKNDVYKQHFMKSIQKRPYWCISRQRSWGVPIPVFYEKKTDTPIINKKILNHLCDLMDKHGSDYWWSLSLDELMPEILLREQDLTTNDIVKGQDILDIWFDSGTSWSSILPDDRVADMYLEGVDQFTGWFQSSLLTSVALRNISPYKSIYVHGFVVDENGLKMSKSVGNVIDPQVITQGRNEKAAYGIDTLRWWVAYHASQDSLSHISNNILQSSFDEVQKIRNALRFTLGGLADYKNTSIDYALLKLIDKYMLHLLSKFQTNVHQHLDDYQFNQLCKLIINFVTNSVSALYYTAIKDRLYCDDVDSLNRKSVQYVLQQIFYIMTRSIAPIVPHLAEELYLHLPNRQHESFFHSAPIHVPSYWESSSVEDVMKVILSIKKDINEICGSTTLEKNVTIRPSSKLFKLMQVNQSIETLCIELRDIFQVAEVNILEDIELNDMKYVLQIHKSNLKHCIRCRRFASKVDNELCKRCSLVIEDHDKQVSSSS